MTWIIINGIMSVIVACIVTWELSVHTKSFILCERIGMGLFGGAVVLNIGPILMSGSPFRCRIGNTPFDDWGSMMIRVGLAIYFGGRLYRNWRHSRNNKLTIKGFKKP